jgi:hypothetical protein
MALEAFREFDLFSGMCFGIFMGHFYGVMCPSN